MRCHHFDAGECRSCRYLASPYLVQLAAKQADVAVELGVPPRAWLEPVASPEAGFRNKAKMVVTGSANEPVLTLPGGAETAEPEDQAQGRDVAGAGDGAARAVPGERAPVDLSDCPLYPDELAAVFPAVKALIRRAQVAPYDVARRRGELKYVIVTCSPAGELMVRFVLRSDKPVVRLREHLYILTRHPGVAVVSCNIQPEHAAVLEGEQEILLTQARALDMAVNGHTLRVGPQSFFQTNTVVAEQLYAQVGQWVDVIAPRRVVDLFCGVGGFALHATAPGREVIGLELSADAVASAASSATVGGVDARFAQVDLTGSLTALDDALGQGLTGSDLVVVNPPRRGIGPELCAWVETSGVGAVIYSSCNPETLAGDLARLPSFELLRARLFDMFPHTEHAEVAVLLARR